MGTPRVKKSQPIALVKPPMLSKRDPAQPSYLQLEREISKVVYAVATRNAQISSEVVTSLCDRLSLEDVAGVILVSLEQLLWLDTDAFAWAVNHLLPAEVLREMRRLSAVIVGKRLVDGGFVPGQDFSVGAAGNLLLNNSARKLVVGR